MKPVRYFGLHMTEGVAEYRQENKDAFRVFLNESTIKNMDASFAGCPVYVKHKDKVDFDKIGKAESGEIEEVGYVVKSFYNAADGKHWAEFLIISERGVGAIKNGWKLSNAYIPETTGAGGEWHGVRYEKEIKNGKYEHLALVPDPRYAESVILTPEQFKEYNQNKEMDLKRLVNEKEQKMSKFNFFKKAKIENSADLETMLVTLPKSGKEVQLTSIINEADEAEVKKDEPAMANGEHHVMVGESKMTVNELLGKHAELCNKLASIEKPEPKKEEVENGEDEEAKKKALELAAHEEKEIAAKKENEKKEEEDKVKNALEEKARFDALKNAPLDSLKNTVKIQTSTDRMELGKARYGSRK